MRELQIAPAEQFDDFAQQENAATTGMWVFLATEAIFFGGLFLAYLIYRTTYPREFAVGSSHSNVVLGTINTAILLTSSFTMALAVKAVQIGKAKATGALLLVTAALGLVFIGIKSVE